MTKSLVDLVEGMSYDCWTKVLCSLALLLLPSYVEPRAANAMRPLQAVVPTKSKQHTGPIAVSKPTERKMLLSVSC
jgi:hypothetical protein